MKPIYLFILILSVGFGCNQEEEWKLKTITATLGEPFKVNPNTRVVFEDEGHELMFNKFVVNLYGISTAYISSNALPDIKIKILHNNIAILNEEDLMNQIRQDDDPNDYFFREIATFSGYKLTFLEVTEWHTEEEHNEKNDYKHSEVVEAEFILEKEKEE
ncbi:MAG: hypothetical protein OEX02_21315 [Cyclobacteriaceae bacterium]|nr:hypothetical protein [Cyclobacteriaceae bacterium]